MMVSMIDYGTCGLNKLQPREEQWLDGIRVIFKKEKMKEAIAFCRQVKTLGYLVFVQAVSITSYSDEELNQLVELVNECHPFAMSMVDTYGLLDMDGLSHIISVIDRKLHCDIMLGYHAHNNFQLGYANAISVLNTKTPRGILVDGSLYGMGKSAGNAPVELIAMYMDRNMGKSYDISQMQEAIATCVLDMFMRKPWGYTLFYYISASNNCHPDYVSYLMNKRTLSVTAVNEILQSIPKEERLGKNMKLIEKLYIEYQNTKCDDTATLLALRDLLYQKDVMVLGPGRTIREYEDDINGYIRRERPVVLAINYIPGSNKLDYLFLTNSRRYLQMSSKLTEGDCRDIPIIATSNVMKAGGTFPYVVNYSGLIDETADIPDNSLVMLLKLLERIEVKNIALAGFDGYTPDTLNYFDTNMEYSFIKEKANSLNRYVQDFLRQYAKRTDTQFITPSKYEVLP